jgi:hypothetical protein
MCASEPEEIWGNKPLSGCFLYRRKVMEAVGDYDQRWRLAQDRDYWLRVYHSFPMARIPEVHYEYRVHSGALSAEQVPLMEEHLDLLDVYAETLWRKRTVRRWRWELRAKQARRSPWRLTWCYLRGLPYDLGLVVPLCATFPKAVYSSCPEPLKRAWRRIRRRGASD